MAEQRVQRRLAAILAADVVCYTGDDGVKSCYNRIQSAVREGKECGNRMAQEELPGLVC